MPQLRIGHGREYAAEITAINPASLA